MIAWGYGRNTVRRALALLEQEKFILTRQGSGSYVSAPPVADTRSDNIAVVSFSVRQYIFSELMAGIVDGLKQFNKTPLIYDTGISYLQEANILKHLPNKHVDGIIVQGLDTALPTPNLKQYQNIIDSGIPVVFVLNHCPALSGYSFVGNDDVKGGAKALRYLYDAGYRRPGAFMLASLIAAHDRCKGIFEEAETLGIPLERDQILWSLNINGITAAEQESLLKLAKKCDSLICFDDYYARKATKIFLDAGLRIPEDIAILSFDNSLLASSSNPSITSLDGQTYKIGLESARLLCEGRLVNCSQNVILPWKIVQRQST